MAVCERRNLTAPIHRGLAVQAADSPVLDPTRVPGNAAGIVLSYAKFMSCSLPKLGPIFL